jgi:hypothetical protein
MAAAEKEPKAPREAASDGAWVVIDDAGTVQAVERSELRAWRIAGPMKATVVRWPFGLTRDQHAGLPR